MIKLYLKSFKVLHMKFKVALHIGNLRNSNISSFPKFQSHISSKLSENLNVIDMLNGIIGKDEEEKPKKKSKKSESDSSPERIKTELLESMKRKKKEAEEK